MQIRPAQTQDTAELQRLIAEFRVALAEVRGRVRDLDLNAAQAELAEYHVKGFPIYVAEAELGELVGYLVCRVEGEVVWAESLYVRLSVRRQGIGTALYAQAEMLAHKLGGDAPYNWVDPDNEKIIRFLQQRGYNVLNLIELRRPYTGEELAHRVQVGDYEFDRRQFNPRLHKLE